MEKVFVWDAVGISYTYMYNYVMLHVNGGVPVNRITMNLHDPIKLTCPSILTIRFVKSSENFSNIGINNVPTTCFYNILC